MSSRAAGEIALDRLREAWERFWFTPQESSTLSVLRSALGLVVFAWALSLGPDLWTFFAQTGLLPEPTYRLAPIRLLAWFPGNAALLAVYAMTLVAAACVALGVAVRIAAPLLFVGVISFHFDNPHLWNAGDNLIRCLCAYLAVYALITPGRFMGVSLPRLLRARAPGAFPRSPYWLVRLIQIQMTLIYPFSVADKLRGETWLDGTAALRALQLVEIQRFPLPEFVTSSLALGAVLTYTTLAIELSVPLLLWIPRTRRLAIVLAASLHLGLDYALRLGFFSWIMWVGLLAFVTPREMTRLLTGGRDRAAGA